MEKEFKIKGLMMDPVTNSPIVILQDLEETTLLPIPRNSTLKRSP